MILCRQVYTEGMTQASESTGHPSMGRFPWEAMNGYRRRLLVVWLVAAILAVVDLSIGLFGFKQEWKALYAHILENEHHHVELLSRTGNSRQLNEQVLSLLVLRDELNERGFLESPQGDLMLTRDFTARINETHRLASLAMLNRQGKEVVRVNAVNGRAHVVSPDHLQDRHADQVFTAARAMGVGQVYIGPMEKGANGQVVIRFALPIHDEQARTQGVLISEYLANQLVQSFLNTAPHVDGKAMLLDANGRWLIGSPDGRGLLMDDALESRSGFGDIFPSAWKTIQASESGQFELPEAVITYLWDNPLNVVEHNMQVLPEEGYFRWAVVNYLPVSYLDRRYQTLASEYLMDGMAGILLILLAAFGASYHFHRQKSKLRQEASTAFLNHILTSSPVVYHVCVRRDGALWPVYFGPGFKELTGYDADELLCGIISGKDRLFEHIHPDDRAAKMEKLRRIGPDEVLQFEFRFQCADGHWIWVESSYMATLNARGEVVELISGWQDISERKHMEEELRSSEGRFRTYAEFSPVGIFQDDLGGRCIYVNRRCCEIIGLSELECLGKGWEAALHPEDVQRVVAGVQAWMSNPDGIHQDEHRLVHPDGKVVWVSAIGAPLKDMYGEVTGFIGALVDITETKMLLSEVQHLSQQLIRQREEENRGLAWALHDDIGQGLVSVHFYSELIRRQCELGNCRESNKLSADLSSMVDSLMQTVNSQLGQIRPGNLEELGLVSALQELAAFWQQSDALRVTVALEEVDGLDWDRELALYRVAQGALVNVIRHAAAKRVNIRLEEIAGLAALTIEDDGCGFSAGTVKGYGLLGMREHMRAVGGKLSVESFPGKGTRIVAEVPIGDKQDGNGRIKS